MPNILKKVEVGNMLYNLEMMEELEMYESAQTDEDLAKAYHHLIDLANQNELEGKPHTLLRNAVYSMIAFSSGHHINIQTLFS